MMRLCRPLRAFISYGGRPATSGGVNTDGENERLHPLSICSFSIPLLRSMFEAIEKHSRTKYGYASIWQVDTLPVQLKNEMPR